MKIIGKIYVHRQCHRSQIHTKGRSRINNFTRRILTAKGEAVNRTTSTKTDINEHGGKIFGDRQTLNTTFNGLRKTHRWVLHNGKNRVNSE